MKNNYEFWEKHLCELKQKIICLCQEKEELYIDLHIHSDYSSDGKQNISEIIKNTKSKGFDIIAITDHDSIEVYNDLFNIVKEGLTTPLIIPGIEFTIDNRDYGNQCHILKLFINPKDKTLIGDVKKNYTSTFNRSKIQFKRLKENQAIQDILKKNKFKISYSEYLAYLNENEMVPEYDTLCSYLIDKFKSNNTTTFDVLNLLEKYNETDCYKDRKELKRKRFLTLRNKYSYEEKNFYNSRFLLSMLAVREVDDDWWAAPSSGSLSVNSYGQLKIEELNTKFMTFFAHPTETKLEVVEKIIKDNSSIIGLEKNIRNKYEDISNFENALKKNKLLKIIGSDNHENNLDLYENMNFYKIRTNDLKKIIEGK